jgi:hypothetical protein
MNKLRDKRIPFHVLMERIRNEIELGFLLFELFFMVSYFCFFIAYVIFESQTVSTNQVNSYMRSAFTSPSFPGKFWVV